MSSYGLKALFEQLLHRYISNDEFKAAMIEAGFTPTKDSLNDTNHRYRLKVFDCPIVPPIYRGRGYEIAKQERRFKHGRV